MDTLIEPAGTSFAAVYIQMISWVAFALAGDGDLAFPWKKLAGGQCPLAWGRNVSAPACLTAFLTCVFHFALAFQQTQPTKPSVATATPVSQGCINQGADRRVAATFVCWAQRHLSWKSEHEPRFMLIGNPEHTNIGLAWPPYLVYNSPHGTGRWQMFRIGFRYDRSWRGYIFLTAAWKRVSHPLRY